MSGVSFCSKPLCQNAKQRWHRRNRKSKIVALENGTPIQQFVYAALHRPRQPCPACTLEDAVPPFIHRDARSPEKPCRGVGGVGEMEIPIAWFDVVHPDLTT